MIKFHQKFRVTDEPPLPSEKKFGWVVGSVLIIFAGIFFNYVLLAIGAGLILFAMIAPNLLKPLNRLWMGFGNALHKIINPCLMFLLYFGCFVPLGFLMKTFFRYDPIQPRFEKQKETYWKEKAQITASMIQQF